MEHYSPLISIIIPIYNAEKYLDKCLTSILEQNFVNYEVILINDGSIDSSNIVCEKYVKADERFFYYQVENGGPSKARNLGIEKASGKYITFIDVDDWIDTDYLSIFISNINLSDTQLIGQFCTYDKMDGTQQKETDDKIVLASGWGKLFERKIIVENTIKFDETMKLGEDTIFTLDYVKYANQIQKINSFGYHYCQKKEGEISLTNSVTLEAFILFVEKLRQKLQEEYVENNIYLRDFVIRHIEEQTNGIISNVKIIKEESKKREMEMLRIIHSRAYRLGKFFLKPLSFIRNTVLK